MEEIDLSFLVPIEDEIDFLNLVLEEHPDDDAEVV